MPRHGHSTQVLRSVLSSGPAIRYIAAQGNPRDLPQKRLRVVDRRRQQVGSGHLLVWEAVLRDPSRPDSSMTATELRLRGTQRKSNGTRTQLWRWMDRPSYQLIGLSLKEQLRLHFVCRVLLVNLRANPRGRVPCVPRLFLFIGRRA